jgi:beta-aspartyl-peptidase (threonine type)
MAAPALIVHGGAGTIDDARAALLERGCADAIRAGLVVLGSGGCAVDAVVAAVRTLEDDPEFSAGVGSALTRAGTVEMDAAVMDGATLRFGAIAAVPLLRRPIDLARAVLDDGEHALLSGDAAWDFARARGMTPSRHEELVTERALQDLEKERARRGHADHAVGSSEFATGDTVGACAIDAEGHVAAATSTGGTVFKRAGRIGDAPLCGCGTYADDEAGAASATGHGESIIRIVMTKLIVDRLRSGEDAQTAASRAVAELTRRTRGAGGVIAIDRDGRIGIAHSSIHMPFAHATVARPEPVTGVRAR